MSDDFDPYRELGLSPEAADEPELVRAAFKALAKKYHPDSYSEATSKAAAEQKMARLNEAQRQILSGEYRPPSPRPAAVTSTAVAAVTPTQPPPSRPVVGASAKKVKRPEPSTVPMVPMVVAVLLLLASFIVPNWLKEDHLAEAQRLEQAGKLSQALEQANLAVADDPRAPAPYLLRARLWLKSGETERARTDLANTRGLLSTTQWERAGQELFPSPSPNGKPSPSPSPTGKPSPSP